jgi:hypothetical protein
MKPEQAASMSKAAARYVPMSCCTRQAVAGNGMSGVMVATMTRSICSGVMPPFSMARVAALAPICEVNSSGAAMRR